MCEADSNIPIFSILLPTFNGSRYLAETLQSLLDQDFTDWELIVFDDFSTDTTYDIARSISDSRIRCFRHLSNLGYGGNLSSCVKEARGKFIFLLGQDDILLPGALRNTVRAYDLEDNVGAVTRPYYWFLEQASVAVREVPPPNNSKDLIFDLSNDLTIAKSLINSLGQLSGLSFKRDLMKLDFHQHVFTSHLYPIMDILRHSKGVFLSHETVAIRIASSQTRFKSEIYNPPPLQTWVEMVDSVFCSESDLRTRLYMRKYLGSSNFVDLVQIRNYSTWKIWAQEVRLFLQLRPNNLVDARFMFITLICLITPRQVLRYAVDIFKKQVLSRFLDKRSRYFTVGG